MLRTWSKYKSNTSFTFREILLVCLLCNRIGKLIENYCHSRSLKGFKKYSHDNHFQSLSASENLYRISMQRLMIFLIVTFRSWHAISRSESCQALRHGLFISKRAPCSAMFGVGSMRHLRRVCRMDNFCAKNACSNYWLDPRNIHAFLYKESNMTVPFNIFV